MKTIELVTDSDKKITIFIDKIISIEHCHTGHTLIRVINNEYVVRESYSGVLNLIKIHN